MMNFPNAVTATVIANIEQRIDALPVTAVLAFFDAYGVLPVVRGGLRLVRDRQRKLRPGPRWLLHRVGPRLAEYLARHDNRRPASVNVAAVERVAGVADLLGLAIQAWVCEDRRAAESRKAAAENTPAAAEKAVGTPGAVPGVCGA